jgi:YfiH family protein
MNMRKPVLLYYDFGQDVVAFSSTRQGGYSDGNYGQFNINRYCGDSVEAIAKNRQALCQLLHVDDSHLLMPHQVHQTEIATIDDEFLRLDSEQQHKRLEGVDAIMTDILGVCIGVSTADCIPVLLYDPKKHAACAIHAGWRGTQQRIVEKAVKAMTETYGSNVCDLRAQIGPGIGLDSFEVGDEVYDAFAQAAFDMAAISERREKWHINLPLCNKMQLMTMGIKPENISVSDICTYKSHDTFFSARRLGINSGRIFTAIMLK